MLDYDLCTIKEIYEGNADYYCHHDKKNVTENVKSRSYRHISVLRWRNVM